MTNLSPAQQAIIADALEAPTPLVRAMNGDATAAKQFLHEAGFTTTEAADCSAKQRSGAT